MLQEIRHAARMLANNPGFTAVAAVSLALGIGANGAVFSLADALVLRPLTVMRPGDVVTIDTTTPDTGSGGISYPEYRDIRDKTRSFDGVVAFNLGTFGFAPSPKTQAQMRAGMFVSGNFFRTLGIEPVLGRGFVSGEVEAPGRDSLMVLSNEFWATQFARDPAVVGRTVRLNGIDVHIIGVAPESFTGMDQYVRPAFYLPLTMRQRLYASPKDLLEDRGDRFFTVKARLKPGVTEKAAQAELSILATDLQRTYPLSNRNRRLAVRTELEARYQQDAPDAILVATLAALAGLVLIIACANVANLLLMRARARSREIAIRLAIGAGRIRLLRQLLTENLMLALLGGGLGILVAYVGIDFFQGIKVPGDFPIVIAVQLDHRVLLFNLFTAIVSALLFGLAPAWQAVKADLAPALKSGGQSVGGRKGFFNRSLGRNTLVVGQVALSMVLLVSAGMLLDEFRKMLVLNPGFRTDHLLTMEFDPSFARYTAEQSRQFYRNLTERARTAAGVRSVALARTIPLSTNLGMDNFVPEGYEFTKGRESVAEFCNRVDEHYFDTMGTPIQRGRGFTAGDKEGAPRVAVVNEQFAKTYWPGQDPIGKRFHLDNRSGPLVEVVGLTATGKYIFVAEPATSFVFLPYAQNPRTRMTLIVETYGDPTALAAPLREVVRSIDPDIPVYNVRSVSSFYRQRAIAVARQIMQSVTTMGLLGLTLALIGLYGLIAYSVSRRTREIGIRMAVGAGKDDVLRMILRQGFVLSLAGIVVGAVASAGTSRLLAAGLLGLGKPNTAVYFVVPVALLIVTTAACYLPARRAAQVDPMRALRWE